MRETAKRLLAILLAVSMSVGACPTEALAAETANTAVTEISAEEESMAEAETTGEAAEAAESETAEEVVETAEPETAEEAVETTTEEVETESDEKRRKEDTSAVEEDATEPAVDSENSGSDDGIAVVSSDTDYAYAVSGGYIYFDESSGTVTDADTTVTSVTIPSTINGVAVTRVEDYAFGSCSNLTKLTLPDSVTSLGYCMIEGTGITSITIPKNVSSTSQYDYSDGPLAGAEELTKVIFAEGITKIPDYILASGNKTSYVTDVVIPDSVTCIDNYAFYYCRNLNHITLPVGLKDCVKCFV